MSSLKSPPVLDEDTNYEMYKKEVQLWEILVGEDLSAEQKGPALVKAIKVQTAREKVLELEVGEIGVADGVKAVLKKLDECYDIEKDQKNLYGIR